MATNLEEITVPEIAGVPNGTICVAEGSYSPSGLMENLCRDLARINAHIESQHPGQSIDIRELTIKIKVRISPPLTINGSQRIKGDQHIISVIPLSNDDGQYIGHGIALGGTYINPRDNTIDFRTCDLENATNSDLQANENAWHEIMAAIRKRIEYIYKNNPKNIVNQIPGLVLDLGYSGTITEGNKKRIVIDQGYGNIPVISRPLSPLEAPSIFPPSE